MKTLSEIKAEIKSSGMDASKAIEILTDYLKQTPDDDEALTMRGMKHWAMGQRSLAINDYLRAIEINPSSKAKQAMEATYDILDFYNKDLYNP